MTLTLTDLRYLLRLVQCDLWEGDIRRSLRIEGKLAEMLGRMKGGMQTMAPKKKSKAAPKKATGKAATKKGKR